MLFLEFHQEVNSITITFNSSRSEDLLGCWTLAQASSLHLNDAKKYDLDSSLRGKLEENFKIASM
jgi:hypothetical protein